MDRYEEALAKARAGKSLEEIFPEMKESEDERIRKHLIEIVETYWGKTNEPGKAADLAWLEKRKEYPTNEEMLRTLRAEYEKGVADTIAKYEQKEQKPVIYEDDFVSEHKTSLEILKHYLIWAENSEEDCPYTWKELAAAIKDGIMALEQKPAEWSEDWREEDVQTRFAFYTYKDDPSVLYLSNVFVEETSRNHGFGTRILKAAEKVAEAIGATTISLKVKQNSSANAWYRKNGYGYVAFEDGYDWLEKNLEYMKPNKQEWNEKDNIMLDNIILCLKEYCLTDEINWLKSLRPPQYCENCKLKRSVEKWKPSEQ